MKNHLLKTALLAIAGLALVAPRSQAQEAYTADDLLLSVYQTGNNTEYTIDLGQASQYMTGGSVANASAGNAISLGNYGADLTAIFGSWQNSSTTSWSIIGTSGNVESGVSTGTTAQGEYLYTLFASNKETTPGTQTTAWSNASKNAQANAVSPITSYGGTLPASSGSFNSAPLTGPKAETYGTGSTNSYVGTISPTDNYFATGGTMEDNFSQGTGKGGATVDLDRLTANTNVDPLGQSSVVPPQGQVYIGSFNFTSTGVLDFSTSASSFATVPEPSTYAFMGVGSLLLMVWFRRRARHAITS